MQGRFRLLALVALGLAVATIAALIVSRIQPQGSEQGVPAAPTETETTADTPTSTETTSEPSSTEQTTTSTSTFTSTSTSTSSSSSGPVTIAVRKAVTTAPSCPALITGPEITQLTATTATPEQDDKGYCGFDLASGGSAAGVVMVVLTQSTDAQGAEATTFEGNTAYRTTTAATTCDLRVALTDDLSAQFRALWVTVVLTKETSTTCPVVEKVAKTVFDKLPNG
jgi:hypothetical protein